jgi:hypothetical protein
MPDTSARCEKRKTRRIGAMASRVVRALMAGDGDA